MDLNERVDATMPSRLLAQRLAQKIASLRTGHVPSTSGADFTSALFLGQRHPSRELRPWEEFTTGVPAALERILGSRHPRLPPSPTGSGRSGLVARSALHGLMDVLETLPKTQATCSWSTRAPTRWPAAHARPPEAQRGAGHHFPHHRPPTDQPKARTWLVTDGWCQGCELPAPLARMQALVRSAGAGVIVDDSLAFGVLGRSDRREPLRDGTGNLRWSGLDHDGFLWLASLAKAYGTPLTVITGDESAIRAVAV